MTKETIILFLLPLLLGCYNSKNNFALREGVYFPHTSGQMSKMILKRDSLFSYHINGMGIEKLSDISIVNIVKGNDRVEILKGVKVKTPGLNSRQSDINRYTYFVFSVRNKNEVKLVYGESYPTEEEVDSILNSIDTARQFGLTFYRRSYFDTFNQLKAISSKSDYETIYKYLNSEEAQMIVEEFNKQGMIPIYGWSLTSELLNQACLKNGYNPLGAAEKLRAYNKD